MQILPETTHTHASVDVGAVFVFGCVNDHKNWAIELLQDGEKGEEHVSQPFSDQEYRSRICLSAGTRCCIQEATNVKRFLDDGTYSVIMDYAKEYVIIDIRQSQNSGCALSIAVIVQPETKQNVVYAMCNENFESVRLLFPDGKE
ncbi:558_t:CDS:2 [Paraglomus occultum]|uniref:558_t:CDS:1 n=1 Tax=Paraglomus occultum TaxID=144539 RepID=A0A9N9BJJ0_9GLOM|nr:558_t:CDS:2 [Paraglomus occultum]